MRARSLAAGLAVILCSAAAANGQQAQAPADQWTSFTAPDGSRFLLLRDDSTPLVHWAVATMACDPPGLPGLTLAAMHSSLMGTWTTGSTDRQAEALALQEQDDAFHGCLASGGAAAALERLTKANEAVERLGDKFGFRRALAALPVHRPEVLDRHPVCVLVLTTVPAALSDVGRLLVQRREETALRDLQPLWVQSVTQRGAQARPENASRAEILALAIPDHPFVRSFERTTPAPPRRSDAINAWQASQRPERTVHVLMGNLEPAVAEGELRRIFAATSLPAIAAPPAVVPRPIQGARRSVVHGARTPTVSLAFVLPPIDDRAALEVAARWLGGGTQSRLHEELQQQGRSGAAVACTAPWPGALDGRGLLLLEVTDAGANGEGGDIMVATCRKLAAETPSAAALQAALTSMQRDWIRLTNDPRWLAVEVADAALSWPNQPPRTRLPDTIDAKAVQQLLARIVAGPPVIVEGRP